MNANIFVWYFSFLSVPFLSDVVLSLSIFIVFIFSLMVACLLCKLFCAHPLCIIYCMSQTLLAVDVQCIDNSVNFLSVTLAGERERGELVILPCQLPAVHYG